MSDTVKRYAFPKDFLSWWEGDHIDVGVEFVLAVCYDRDIKALETRCAVLERRPTIAKFNALQEECDGRLTVHQCQVVQAAEQTKTIERLEAMLAEAQKHLTLSQLVTMQAALEGK